jgi:PAS domain S-box-containing protein
MKQHDVSGFSGLNLLNLLNGLPHGVVLIDNAGGIVTANRIFEAFTGYLAADVLGVGCDFVLRANPDIKKTLLEAPFDGPETLALEGDIINVNRKKAFMRFFVSPLINQNGTRIGYMVAVEDITALKERGRQHPGVSEAKGILGHSPKMQEILDFMPILARTDTTLLITGETGTGKDLLAEAIHHESKRASYPFIKVNCGALPETLLESELFGHVRGAYTGAHTDKPGMFRLAQGGTLFLTEIGDLPLALQVKLLTVLDDREFYPLGSSKKVQVDVRLITGTNRDLRQMVKEGNFREDLYYRLNVLRAHMPPLRERGDDAPLLLDHFAKLFAANLGKGIKGFSAEASAELANYAYPGNVRELRNIVEYAVNVCPSDCITPSHLPTYIHASALSHSPLRETNRVEAAPQRADNNSTSPPNSETTFAQGNTWTEIEKSQILGALMKTGGNRSLAALDLGWGRSTLWRKIKRYGLE